MMTYFRRWLGELLIDIGRRLVRGSRDDFIRYQRTPSRNRYEW